MDTRNYNQGVHHGGILTSIMSVLIFALSLERGAWAAQGRVAEEYTKDIRPSGQGAGSSSKVENGLEIISDGEFGRSWWRLDFLWELTGFEAYQPGGFL